MLMVVERPGAQGDLCNYNGELEGELLQLMKEGDSLQRNENESSKFRSTLSK